MREHTRVQGRCPSCGPLTLLPRDLVCALPRDPTTSALVEFHCPLCDGAVFNDIATQEAKLLILLGAGKAGPVAPFELTEKRSGPPITPDELLDLHAALEAMCCPQTELAGGAR